MAANLFGLDETAISVDIEDQIAHAYALLRSGKADESKSVSERYGLYQKEIDVDHDWRILNATLIFAFDSIDRAKSEVAVCVRDRFESHSDLENIVHRCDQIIASIADFPECLSIECDRNTERQHSDREESPVPGNSRQKFFVCGNGWSGSGALCDALANIESVAFAPDIPIDQFINKDTNNELMFVQGERGLGRLWRQAREGEGIGRMDLWELFRCHIVGLGPIGFAEHKSANAAASLLARHGSLYAGQFQTAFDGLADLSDKASLADLRELMVTVTDSLTELIFDAGDDQCAVFNNAMFGANLDMVEIFSSFKLVVVVRDPLDQYADRREQDLKHWMSARRFVSFYKSGRAAFHTSRKKLPPNLSTRVREVQFEKFVQDSGYREGVLDWLFEELGRNRIADNPAISARFDPEISSGNVGIHKTLLTNDEAELLDSELREWRCR